jgi:3-methyl-2-oxobutanoate hydroxymethyltransferase
MSRALTNNISTASRGIVSLTRSHGPRCLSSPVPGAYLTSPSTSDRSLQHDVFHHGQKRYSSHSPLGAPPVNARKKVTLPTLQSMYKKNEPITMLTAYDFPSAHVADHAGMDMILVGDSLAMVSMGLEDTSEVTMDDMIFAARSVARATKSAFTVC